MSSLVVFHVLVAPWVAKSLGYHEEMGPRLSHKVSVKLEEGISGAPGKLCLGESKLDLKMGNYSPQPTHIRAVETCTAW